MSDIYGTQRLLRNQAQCLRCGDVIESTHVHDLVSCSCGQLFVDGGLEYLRRGGDPEWYDELSIYEHPLGDLIQQRALETWHSKDKDFFLQLNHAILQLASEGGEVAALWAKFNYKPAFKLLDGMTREETFKVNLLDELGDVLYYLAILAHLYGWTIEDVSQRNYEKLRGGHGWKTPSQ